MAKRRGQRVRMNIEENVTVKLGQVRTDLQSKLVSQAMHAGAAVMGAPAKAAAPLGSTGMLRAGVYVTSQHRDGFRSLSRPRNGQSLNSPLRNPARRGQALVVASTFYTRFVEGGRKLRTQDNTRGRKASRRGMGRIRKRPFFMRTVRRMKPMAMAVVQRQLVRLIEGAWQR